MDYSAIIDEQTWKFIHATESFYSSDTITDTIEKQRADYNNMCRSFFRNRPQNVHIKTARLNGIPVRVYETDAMVGSLVYYHGGGFVVGGLDSHDDVCAEFCERAQLRVISVDYRLAPEHKHPAQFDDALNAMQVVLGKYDGPIFISGDSAGGNLAAAVSHRLRNHGTTLDGQLLIYPSLGTNMDHGSYRTHAHAPLLSRDDILYYRDVRCDGIVLDNDPTLAPLNDTDFSQLPPTVIITAQCDPLADDGKEYRDRISEAGGRAHWVNEPGLIHGYLRARHSVGRARDSFTRMVDALKNLAKGEWPYGSDNP